MATATSHADDTPPDRARDLNYGWVLYEYHQGNALAALTQLAVAREQGGIHGHGEHPALVEGGLMLSWGMPREAAKVLTRLLGEDGAGSGLSPETRHQAWFYLGKVFYLQGDLERAQRTLSRVSGEVLENARPELFREWIYLRVRMSDRLTGTTSNAEQRKWRVHLEETDTWALYLRYNEAVAALDSGDSAAAEAQLTELIENMDPARESAGPDSERQGLRERAQLSLARLYLQDNRFEQALETLGAMSLDGLLADQALFDYAVAAAAQGQPARAFDALETLSGRDLFLPWRQQVPYARAYVLEQMNQPHQALQGFRRAADHYQARIVELDELRGRLSEQTLRAQLAFDRDSDGILTDAYGRLRVQPADFGLAEMLAEEPFQQALAELEELYRIQAFITERRSRFDAFRVMLDTRQQQRQRRIAQTRLALEEQQASQWQSQHQMFQDRVSEALAKGDARFFMSAEQRALERQLDEVQSLLAELPDDASTARQRNTYRRMRAYLDWWIADDYGVNRWAAQKQLRALNREMALFESQRQRVDILMADDDHHAHLARRIAEKERELAAIDQEVSQALAAARGALMSQVDKRLVARQKELKGYLLAARHAQARLADQLFQASQQSGVDHD